MKQQAAGNRSDATIKDSTEQEKLSKKPMVDVVDLQLVPLSC